MKTADQAHTGPAPAVPTGNFAEVSRRGVLGAMVAAGGVVAVPAAAQAKRDPDARFWQLHAEYQRILAAWESEEDDTDAASNRWGARLSKAEAKLMACPAHSVGVVAAKYAITEGHEQFYFGAYGLHSSLEVIDADLRRLARQERRA